MTPPATPAAQANVRPLLAAVIVTRDEERHIGMCLRALVAALAPYPNSRIAVVDSDSTDATASIAAQRGVEVYRYRGAARSAAAGRAVGTALVDARYILFVDGDSNIVAGWLPLAIAELEADPAAAVVHGPRRNVFEDGADAARSADDAEATSLGGNALYRRTALVAAGGFNPFLKAEEEGELMARLTAAGYRAVATDALMCTHHTVAKDNLLGQWRRVARGMAVGAGQVLRVGLADGLWPAHAARFNRYLLTLAYLLAGGAVAAMALAGAGTRPALLWLGAGGLAFAGLWWRRGRLRGAAYLGVEWTIGAVGVVAGFFAPRREPAAFRPLVDRWVTDACRGAEAISCGRAQSAATVTPSRRMIVAHLISPAGLYGAERWILTLTRYLARCGAEVVLVTVGTGPEAVEVHERFQSDHGDAVHLRYAAKLSLSAIVALRRLLRERSVDVLHTHGFKADVLGYLATRRMNVALVSTPHGWSADEGVRIAAYEMIGRIFMRRCDKVYPVSAALEADLLRRGFRRQQVELIRNAVDDEPLRPVYAARERDGWKTYGRILFVGRLVESKGIFELLEAFARASLAGGPELVIAGAGPDEDAMRRRAADLHIADSVRFAGFVHEIGSLLRTADFVVLPSYREGIPRTLMESAAAGVPILASDISGVRDLLSDGYSAVLVPPRDVTALARGMKRLHDDADLRLRLIRNARAVIDERHTAARQAAVFAAAYEDVCATRS